LNKIKQKVLQVIVWAERLRDFRLRRDEIVQFFQVVIAKPAQSIGNFSRLLDFRSNQPQRENEWKSDAVFPFFAQIPKLVIGMLFPKSNCLITDEQLRVLE